MCEPLKPIRTTVHRSVMPNWAGVRVVLSGPAELLDQIMIVSREGFEIVRPRPTLREIRAATRPPPE